MVPMNTAQQQTINAPLEPFSVHWAQTTAEIEEVQRLRYNVFADELGVKLQGEHGLDRDQFDAYSRHLYVRDNQTGEVVGTYRIITPDVAQKTGWYTQQEFDISDLLQSDEASTLMEVGRACVHKDFRNGSVVLLLWKATLSFAKENGYTIIMGCTSVPIGANAPAINDVKELLKSSGAFTEQYHIAPHIPFTSAQQTPVNPDVKVVLPALFKGYVRLGGKVCGEPAYDADFHCADFFTYLRMDGVSRKYARHFEVA